MCANTLDTHDPAWLDAARTDDESVSSPIGPAVEPAAATVAIMTYNILTGGGARLGAIEHIIRDSGADLVGVQEVTRPDALAALAERLGMHHAIAWSPSGWHVAALSRWPIVQTRGHSGPQLQRALLETLIELPDGGRLRFFVTHLRAVFSEIRAGEDRRLREIAFILDRMSAARAAGEPHLLVGDFNSLAPGEPLRASAVLRHALAVEEMRRARGLLMEGHPHVDYIVPPALRPLRPLLGLIGGTPPLAWACDTFARLYVPRAVVRRMRSTGYIDCYAATHPDPRTRSFTCPSPAPGGRIDYLFASPSLAARLVSCEILTDTPTRLISYASDHRPVLAHFRLDG
jgi:endonuclease/exonuclease/phosphatase family metal-dependent hydrolase